MNRLFRITAAVLLLPLVLCCAKKKSPGSEALLGLDYYPTNEGKFVVYDVDSTVYTELPKDTLQFRYRIKERLADRFTDNEGREAIRLERFIKRFDPQVAYDKQEWSMKEVWMVNADKEKIQVLEGNMRYTKLAFPIQAGGSWNGNANNTIGEWIYSIDYIEKPETINSVKLDKVLRVNQRDIKTLISWQSYAEKYAKGAGLVSREITEIYSNTIQAGVPLENRIEKGFIYKQQLVSYGYE